MSAPSPKVNLLPPSDFESSFWGRFLKWAVTTGRYIIILTELVVILAFLSRFKLDEDLRNLNEQINGQVSFLQLQEGQLQEFLAVQKKVGLVEQILNTRGEVVDTLDYLEQKVPVEITMKVRSVSPKGLAISAVTLDERVMGQLLASMSADLKWASVDVSALTNDSINGIRFRLTAEKAN